MEPIENTVTEALRLRAQRAPAAPSHPTLRESRPQKTKTSGLVVVAAAFGSAVIAIGAVAVINASQGTSGPTEEPPVASPIRPSDGNRLVALGRLAFEVDEGWATDATHCGAPTRDTVIFGGDSGFACLPNADPRVSSLSLQPADSGLGHDWLASMRPDGSLAGHTVFRSMERNADGSVSLGYAVPDLNVVAMVRAASQDAAETVLDTAAVLSEGQAAVPFVVGMSVSEAESTVSEASLVLTTTGSGETVTATRPDAGTVLPVGGSVEASLR